MNFKRSLAGQASHDLIQEFGAQRRHRASFFRFVLVLPRLLAASTASLSSLSDTSSGYDRACYSKTLRRLLTMYQDSCKLFRFVATCYAAMAMACNCCRLVIKCLKNQVRRVWPMILVHATAGGLCDC